jgi:kynurenine formamidase
MRENKVFMKSFNLTVLIFLFILNGCKDAPNLSDELPQPSQSGNSQERIVDLTHEFSEESVYWVTAKEFELDVVAQGETEKGYYYSANNFATAEHGGTHIDAPIHFAKNAQSVDEIPLERLVGEGIKIDVSSKALRNPDYLITIEDFTNWEKEQNQRVPNGSIVLLETGYSRYYPDKIKYLGTDRRGEQAIELLHFPGLSPDAATWLVENRKISAIGIDTPSIDYGQSQYFKSHVTLLSKNIPAFENIMNLDKLPAIDFKVVALPMKIKGGSGAPLRIIAILGD